MKKVQYGIVPGCFEQHFGRAEKYRAMKQLGFDCSDFQHFLSLSDPLYQMSPAEFTAYLTEERNMAAGEGVTFYQIHSPWRHPPQDDTPDERRVWLEAMQTAVRGAAILGAPYMVFHSLMPDYHNPKQDAAFFRSVNSEFILKLSDYGDEYGVNLCLENMPMTHLPIASDREVYDYVNELDHKRLFMCLDTGHANVHHVRPGDALRNGIDKIKTLHIHDNNGYSDSHGFPLTGTIDWQDFAAALTETDFSGILSLETSPSSAAPWPVAEAYLRGLSAFLRWLRPDSTSGK